MNWVSRIDEEGSIPFVGVFLVYESIPKGMLFLIGLNIKIIIHDKMIMFTFWKVRIKDRRL